MPAGLKDISDNEYEKYIEVAIEEAKLADERGDKPIDTLGADIF